MLCKLKNLYNSFKLFFPLILFMFFLPGSNGSNISFIHSLLSLKKKIIKWCSCKERIFLYQKIPRKVERACAALCWPIPYPAPQQPQRKTSSSAQWGKEDFHYYLSQERLVISIAATHRIYVNRIVAQGFTGNNLLELFCYAVFYS